MQIFFIFPIIAVFCLGFGQECLSRKAAHPEWIFCDDFEDTSSLVRTGRYFEYGDNSGDFIPLKGVGVGSSRGMRVQWEQGEVDAGSLKLAFGRNPVPYMNKQQIRPTEDFREIYYRMYLKMQKGWQGGDPAKLSRATVFSSTSDWSQAMIAHLWSDNSGHLLIDPASCVDNAGQVVCQGYNDFNHLMWLGNKSGTTPIFTAGYDDRWYCVEAHVKLNDAGQSNGLQEFWIDSNLEASRNNLNFLKTYTQYAINAVFFESYWNSGSVQNQERYFDNIVVSTQRIGCLDPASSGLGKSRLSPSAPFPHLSPNPFRPPGFLRIEGLESVSVVDIFSTDGRRAAHWDFGGADETQARIWWEGRDRAGLQWNSGTYFVRIKSESGFKCTKFVMVR